MTNKTFYAMNYAKCVESCARKIAESIVKMDHAAENGDLELLEQYEKMAHLDLGAIESYVEKIKAGLKD